MAEKYCSNCCQNISASKFFLHERMCSINVKKCPKCNKPFTVDDLEDHIEEMHTEVECEYCKKKYPKSELDMHKKRCDAKLVPCIYCELQVQLGEIKEHQKACGAITEPCVKCNRFIQRKNMDQHLKDGCPPPKNDRRSVDVIRNERMSLDKNKNIFGNINNNYIPININGYIPDEIFFDENINKKPEIKIHDNMKKPNLQIRPASGKKILNEKAKNKIANFGNSNIINNNMNNINNKNNLINNFINNNNKEINNKNINIRTNNKEKTTNINKTNKTSKPIKKEADKTSNYNKFNKNDYINKQNIANKNAIKIKPINNNNSNYNNNSNMNNSRYAERSNTKKLSSKPGFNISKGSMKISKERKETDEEFRKTRDKLMFKEAKKINNINLNSNVKKKENNEIKIENKKIINDDDYMANFNFGEVDDEQLIQQVIEQSLKDQKKKK